MPKQKKPNAPQGPAAPDDGLRILAFTNMTTSHIWRFDPIASRLMKADGPDRMAVIPYSAWDGDIVGANLVILEMLTGPHIVDTCHNLGAKVIYEADDAIIDTYGRERKNLQHIGPAWRQSSIETLRKVDAITVTSHALAENYRRFTDAPIYVLPIYMDFELYKDPVDFMMPVRNTDEIRIGWFGSRGHLEDLQMIMPALKKVLGKHKNVKLVYCGFGGMSSNKAMTEVGWGKDIFKTLPREQREFIVAVPEWYWPMRHRFMDLDIGICPLVDDEFNHNKVATKYLEFAALRTPTVCSPTVYGENPLGPKYSPTVKHGKTGFIANTTDEWVTYLERLIKDAKLRKTIGDAAYHDVDKKWNMDRKWHRWVEIYKEVLNA